MSERIHALAQQLFGKATIDECNLEEVKNLAHRFPYFAPAQFLLLEKLKQQGSEEYTVQLQKSILYYHNPLEFQYFISSDRFYTDISFDELSEEETRDKIQNTTDATEIVNEVESKHEVLEADAEPKAIIHEPEMETQTTDAEYKEPVSEHPVETLETSPEEQPRTSNPEPIIEETLQPTLIPKLQTQNSQPETALAFEPYHTIDYFASQGIKLSQEEVSKDKFGKQLKSFTEWLKTMKRLPPTQMARTTDSSSENKVQHLADDSIHESDVWTEAMAEVWVKQGNTQKAIETYNKLGLLNPSKKAYFATKIENLKRS
jgi:hypothetical protein